MSSGSLQVTLFDPIRQMTRPVALRWISHEELYCLTFNLMSIVRVFVCGLQHRSTYKNRRPLHRLATRSDSTTACNTCRYRQAAAGGKMRAAADVSIVNSDPQATI